VFIGSSERSSLPRGDQATAFLACALTFAQRFLAVLEIFALIQITSSSGFNAHLKLFCGAERYVALTLIGDLARRNFAEKHHII
jgi:hypothetical protein